jgi:hypothetical protein
MASADSSATNGKAAASTLPLLAADAAKLLAGAHSYGLFILSIWLACPREGHFTSHHPVHAAVSARQEALGCLRPSGCLWPCLVIPLALLPSGVSHQDCLYGVLANRISGGI